MYKGMLTVADIMCGLRERLEDARDRQDDERAVELEETAALIYQLAAERKDLDVFLTADDMLDSIRNWRMGAWFKDFIPEAEAIQKRLAYPASTSVVTATLIRRIRLRADYPPIRAGFWNEAEARQVEPKWAGIAHAQGPYAGKETYDLLLFGQDGTVLLYDERSSSPDDAIALAQRQYGVDPSGWEPCAIEITDAEGRVVWSDDDGPPA